MHSNEEGSVGVIVSLFLLIAFFGIFYLLFGPMVDTSVINVNAQTQNEYFVVSQERMDTLEILINFWWMLPLIVMFVIGYYSIKNALRERSGEVF